MLEFMQDTMIFTGGFICLIFWFLLIGAIVLELFDAVTESDTPKKEG